MPLKRAFIQTVGCNLKTKKKHYAKIKINCIFSDLRKFFGIYAKNGQTNCNYYNRWRS